MNNKKRLLFQLNHPAHFHLFKNVISNLKDKDFDIQITVKNKDILKDLLVGYDFISISNSYRKKNLYAILTSLIRRDFNLLKIVKEFKPDLMIGTSPEIAHVSLLTGIPSMFFGEDDINLNRSMYLGALSSYPCFKTIVSPSSCFNGIWNKKTIFYEGYQKLSYLHPNNFNPDINKINIKGSYFILRFANLQAYHDKEGTGISDNLALGLIKILETKGTIIITSERELPQSLRKYKFNGPVNDIHHYLAYADLFIGDSQSMAVEAAILGTPGIRFNNFAGKISVLNDLEKKYNLTTAVQSSNPDLLIETVHNMLSNQNLKNQYQDNRKRMLAEKIDVTKFFTWLIENYPVSVLDYKNNPEIQYQFK